MKRNIHLNVIKNTIITVSPIGLCVLIGPFFFFFFVYSVVSVCVCACVCVFPVSYGHVLCFQRSTLCHWLTSSGRHSCMQWQRNTPTCSGVTLSSLTSIMLLMASQHLLLSKCLHCLCLWNWTCIPCVCVMWCGRTYSYVYVRCVCACVCMCVCVCAHVCMCL